MPMTDEEIAVIDESVRGETPLDNEWLHMVCDQAREANRLRDMHARLASAFEEMARGYEGWIHQAQRADPYATWPNERLRRIADLRAELAKMATG